MLKKFPSDRINVTKNALFFLSRAPTHHSFTFNSQFLYKLTRKFHFFKAVRGTFHLRFCFIFIKFMVCSTKIMDSLTLKRHHSFQNKNDRKATHSFAPRPLFFKLHQEV